MSIASSPPPTSPNGTAHAQQEAPPAANSGRDGKGRFTAGNQGGPGNPFGRQVARLRQALLDAVTPEDFQAIARRLIELAVAGNVPAAKVLLAYTIGKPAPAPDPDRLDADEWQCFKETANMAGELPQLAQSPAPSLPLSLVRTLRPEIAKSAGGLLGNVLSLPQGDFERFKRAADHADPSDFLRQLRLVPPSPNDGNGASPKPNGKPGKHSSPNGKNGHKNLKKGR